MQTVGIFSEQENVCFDWNFEKSKYVPLIHQARSLVEMDGANFLLVAIQHLL